MALKSPVQSSLCCFCLCPFTKVRSSEHVMMPYPAPSSGSFFSQPLPLSILSDGLPLFRLWTSRQALAKLSTPTADGQLTFDHFFQLPFPHERLALRQQQPLFQDIANRLPRSAFLLSNDTTRSHSFYSTQRSLVDSLHLWTDQRK